ncbi:MAG: AAA family ATPase [Myxococcota bacterium]
MAPEIKDPKLVAAHSGERALPPSLLSRFGVGDRLGEGSMGIVFEARDARTETDVAIKILHEDNADALRRLKREFRSLAHIAHPNLVELYELFVEGGTAWFTMEKLSRVGIAEWLSERAAAGDRAAALRLIAHSVARGLEALHRAGQIHRDVKPSNIGVSADGRLVLLDFGLAAAMHAGDGPGMLSGTPVYMSPAQMWGGTPDPRDDWYALAVTMYELATGQLPFPGDFDAMLRGKTAGLERTDGLESVADAPLTQLIVDTLSPSGDARSGAPDHGRWLGADLPSGPGVAEFVGRTHELDQLNSAYRESTRRPLVFRVSGPSGVGKTELLTRFCTQLPAETVVLRSKCNPRESVSFNAFDGLVDELAAYLRRDATPTLRAGGDDAVGLFPALRECFPDHALPRDTPPLERRLRGVRALRRLLAALAQHARTVVWLDDFQWADSDSQGLLLELIRGQGDAPILWAITTRPIDDDESGRLDRLEALPGSLRRHLPLQRLPDAEAHALARGLLDDSISEEGVEAVLQEAHGNPFLIRELARASLQNPDLAELGDYMKKRMGSLSENEQKLLTIVSLSDGPLGVRLASAAAELGPAGERAADRLRKHALLRLTQRGGQPALAVYHDRIRDYVVTARPREARHAGHLAIAQTLLKAGSPDPERLVHHFVEADAGPQAAAFAEPAGDQAAERLAFDRAARLYGVAVELGPSTRARALLLKQAEAEVNGGRGAAAARVFLEASRRSDAENGEEVVELQRRAAEQLIRSGHYDDGKALMSQVLEKHGVTMPSDEPAAMRRVMSQRLRLLWRGLRPKPRKAPPAARLNALWAATSSMSMLNHTFADAFGSLHLIEALGSSSVSRWVRGLGYEATCEASFGGTFFGRRSQRILAQLPELLEQTDDPYDHAWVDLARGTCAWLRGEWAEAVSASQAAQARFESECRGTAWEVSTAAVYRFSAMAMMGRYAELAREVPAAIEDAEGRGDLFAANSFRLGQHNAFWLAEDNPAQARRWCDEAEATWPRDTFHMQRYQHFVAMAQVELHEGDAAGAWSRVKEVWPKLKAAGFLRLEYPRVELAALRGRAAAAFAWGTDGAPVRKQCQRELNRVLRVLRGSKLPVAAAHRSALQASSQALSGDPQAAADRLADAAARYEALGMSAYAGAAKLGMDGAGAGPRGRWTNLVPLGLSGSNGVRTHPSPG